MERYVTVKDNDTLSADLSDTPSGKVRLIINMSRNGRSPVPIQVTLHDSYQDARQQLADTFKGLEWQFHGNI